MISGQHFTSDSIIFGGSGIWKLYPNQIVCKNKQWLACYMQIQKNQTESSGVSETILE